VTELDPVRAWIAAAVGTLESARQRVDDLNVYPVPDGDTGTNLLLTVRALQEALATSDARDREAIAHDVTRAVLMGARGNSGVILSQIVRGAAEVLAERAGPIDTETLARALRGASDAAYRAVRRPVEGTMLSVVRELAEEAESRVNGGFDPSEVLLGLVARGEEALARTPEQLDILREAGVVDAGGAGLLELLRGLVAAVTGASVPEPARALESVGADAVHRELSRYRYCTAFLIEGDELDRDGLEGELERLGDSLLVVGDETALKVHVHTDDPGAALSLATARGSIRGVEIADMHEQTARREERLLHLVEPTPAATGVVAVAIGAGNRRLFESLGAALVVEGGQTMNPSTADLLSAVDSIPADGVVLLPNNSNVVLAAEQAARLSGRPVQVVGSESMQAGLAAMVAFDASRSIEENALDMREAATQVVSGEVTVASRNVDLNGFSIRKGSWLGLAEGEPVAGGDDFEEVAAAVVERLLAEPREVLTLLTGDDEPSLDGLLTRIAALHPGVELDVHSGGQPHYALLLGAE
jgi:DAK2 domain fusion protein YloV